MPLHSNSPHFESSNRCNITWIDIINHRSFHLTTFVYPSIETRKKTANLSQLRNDCTQRIEPPVRSIVTARTCTHHSLCLPPCFRYRPKFARVSNNENYCSPATHNRPPKTSRCHAFPFCRIPKFSTIATQLIESNQRFFDPSVRADARCLRRGQLRGNFAHRGRIHTVFHRW